MGHGGMAVREKGGSGEAGQHGAAAREHGRHGVSFLSGMMTHQAGISTHVSGTASRKYIPAGTLDVAIVIAIPSSEWGAYTKRAFDEWEIATRVRGPRVAEINKIEETVRMAL
ncbi:hypothetical protein MAE02_62080 [Microvirga aerophila]|uniref:Uncharacterized protein n=1 Tax=Microvirga aerophila TaxID=670291 RepID=A0A512C2S4_9HYPH|nr:hypothetical protein MAE02_62080 [Microvirga aerophila]